MRSFLQVVSGIVLALSGVLAVLGSIALVHDGGPNLAMNAIILGGLLLLFLFAGALWMLTEIAEQLAPKPLPLPKTVEEKTGEQQISVW